MADAMLIAGDRALTRKLASLERKAARRAISKGLRAAATPLVKSARQQTPVGTGNLRKSLTKKIKNYQGVQLVVIGPGFPAGAHGHLVERGTAARYRKSGASSGRMPARPFLVPAFIAGQAAAVAVMRAKISAEILAEARK